ncbi:MAG: hypothetical protein ACFFAN_09765 [Promethearchaeota archaeon]
MINLKKNLLQIRAILDKEIKLETRFKGKFLLGYFSLLIRFIMPYIILRKLLEVSLDRSLGIWTADNYLLFLLVGFEFVFMKRLIRVYSVRFQHEKYWKTLPAVLISPINKFNLLIGIFLSQLIFISIPMGLIITIMIILFPIDIISIIVAILILILSCFFLACIGMAVGALSISLESLWIFFDFFFGFILIFSCYNYPKEVFPIYLQPLIIFNPFFYFWDIIRYIWLFGLEFTLFNPDFTVHFIVISSCAILGPTIGIPAFNYIYKKYGIVGY